MVPLLVRKTLKRTLSGIDSMTGIRHLLIILVALLSLSLSLLKTVDNNLELATTSCSLLRDLAL